MQPLPIDQVLEQAAALLAQRRRLVLCAPPGSGKSTRLPPMLSAASAQQVVLLQPRRIAARSIAQRIASERGWRLGEEVGYRVRHERVGCERTRLWVMTEGTLTRRLLDDPYLEGVGTVILDEFHERSIHSDLALAWIAQLQNTVREDLRLVVMSATMDSTPVAAFLGSAPVLDAPGQPYPVTLRHLAASEAPLAQRVLAVVSEALEDAQCGDLLVFLPGVGEIRACQALIEGRVDADVLMLHARAPIEDQERALRPGGRTRVILSTNVAETSLTLPGVRTVIDSGLARINRFNPDSGLDELRLEGISRASAAQRAGRAGRTAPGRCWRMWSQSDHARRSDQTEPEIARVDLAPCLLQLKSWHGADPRTFPWFTAPQTQRLEAAEELLALLGATAAPYAALTERGAKLARLSVHPRLGRMILDAQEQGVLQLGCTLAALLGERDVRLVPRGSRRDAPPGAPCAVDALDRLERLERAERAGFAGHLRDSGIDPSAARDAVRVRDELLGSLDHARRAGSQTLTAETVSDDQIVGLLLAAYPDRVGRRAVRDGNRATMVGGIAVELDPSSGLATRSGFPRGDLMLAYGIQGLGSSRGQGLTCLVTQAGELSEERILAVHPGSILRREQLVWNDQRQQVDAMIGWYYRDICVRMAKDGSAQADADALAQLLVERLAPQLPALLLEDAPTTAWLSRYRWLRLACPDLALPDIGEAQLQALLVNLCHGCRSRSEVLAKPMLSWLQTELSHEQRMQVEDFAPEHVTVPSGSHIRLDYSDADALRPPVLSVRLQELFGSTHTPSVAGGRIPVLLHLLAPNYRIEQVTRDLAGFWANTYLQVRKDLRNRYPKHSWPDDPLSAPAQAKGRPRQT